MTETKKNQHSVFLLNYCLVLTTKGRKPLLCSLDQQQKAKKIITDLIASWKIRKALDLLINITEIRVNPDNIEIFLSASPQTNLSKLVNALKIITSKGLQAEPGPFWAPSYLLLTFGDNTEKIKADYLETLKEA